MAVVGSRASSSFCSALIRPVEAFSEYCENFREISLTLVLCIVTREYYLQPVTSVTLQWTVDMELPGFM